MKTYQGTISFFGLTARPAPSSPILSRVQILLTPEMVAALRPGPTLDMRTNEQRLSALEARVAALEQNDWENNEVDDDAQTGT